MTGKRESAVSGMFYHEDKDTLTKQLEEMFSKAREGSNRMVVSPHAGYAYSGKTAAHAISSLRKTKEFIVLGPNHTGRGKEFSIMSSGSWNTPLGDVTIDREIAEKIKKLDFVEEYDLAHSQEHSIEVQLPFLQHRFKRFKFVPVCIMNIGYSDDFIYKCQALGKTIASILHKKDVGVIASSDFSHYLPQNVADMKDEAAVEKIMNLDITEFFRKLEEVDASVCGFGPIAVVMSAAKELGLKAKLIHKSSSGDETGERDAVVAYYAIGFG